MKLALITPRYGAEIGGGGAHACRLYAEQLSRRHAVDVLTTCARSEDGWANVYPESSDRIRGVLVRRFATESAQPRGAADDAVRQLVARPHGRQDELDAIRRAGPYAPGLLEHLKRQHRNYDALVFFSASHATTVFGAAVAPERSVLFPCLRVDPVLRLAAVQDALMSIAAVGFVSPAEGPVLRAVTRRRAGDDVFVGIGVQPPAQLAYPRLDQEAPGFEDVDETPEEADEDDAGEQDKPHLSGRGALFRRRHRLDGQLALYGGRVEADNGCEEMIEYFHAYEEGGGTASLVLLGVKMIRVGLNGQIRLAGILPARERMGAFEAADVTLAPDPADLAAESALESFAAGTPVLAAGRHTTAAIHCRRAGGGLYYDNRAEFVEALTAILSNEDLRKKMGESGRRYIQQSFRWDAVLGRFERLLTKVKPR